MFYTWQIEFFDIGEFYILKSASTITVAKTRCILASAWSSVKTRSTQVVSIGCTNNIPKTVIPGWDKDSSGLGLMNEGVSPSLARC